MKKRSAGRARVGVTPAKTSEQRLRKRAEDSIERRQGVGRRSDELRRGRLVHELEVHQVELQTQNEELKRARVDLEAALERYTELFEFAPLGYVILSQEGIIREINHAGALMLNNNRARLVNRPFRLQLAQGRDAFDRLLAQTLDSEIKQLCEAEFAKEGDLRRVRITGTRLMRGEPQVLVALEDITDLVRNEMALREAGHRKDEFLAMLSHELRNPLAPIRLSLAVLSHAGAGPEQTAKARHIIDRQVTHMTRLVDDLLDVNRIAQGKIRLARTGVELGELVRRTLEDYRSTFEADGIRLEERIELGTFELEADGARLVQALSNLLGNAQKFTPTGGLVLVTLKRLGPTAVLSVQDTGVGIEPEVLQRVFEPFVQAPQTMDRARGGLGLGLAMVKGIVDLHDGRVSIASDGLNQGTRITISLPLRSSALESSADTQIAMTNGPRRVLVIDDSLDTVDSMRDALVLDGHEVQVAYEGEKGLELARAFHPDVVLCDLGLPGMDGYAVAEAFRADPALEHVHLIALSGYRRPEDVERALRAGFNHHLAKPPRLEAVEQLIAKTNVNPASEKSALH